jgi:Ribosomal protein L7/L12 C-terminal domain
MAFNDPNLSIQVEQLTRRLEAVESQLAVLSQRVGMSYPQAGGYSAPPSGGVSFDPKTGTVSFDPGPAAPPMGAPAGQYVDPQAGAIPAEVVALARSNKKIQAIKLYRELTGLGLKEAKAVVDRL